MSLIASVVLFCGVFLTVIYSTQERMLYFPDRTIRQTPAAIGLGFEEIRITTKDDVRISAWYVPAAPERGTLLFCHGNAGNISDRLDSIRIFHSLGLSVLIFDYRGYGKSEGSPSESGTYLDAEAAWDWVVNEKRTAPSSLVIFGESLGGAVAAELALKRQAAGLIIESSFTSVPDLGKKFYPWLPVGLLARNRYPTLAKVGAISCPKLFIHSPDDEIVPYAQGRALYEAASAPKYFLEIRGGHNDGFLASGAAYVDGLERFLREVRVTQ